MEIGNIDNVNPVNVPEQVDSGKSMKQSEVKNQNIANQQASEISDKNKNKKKNKDNIGNAVDKLNKAAAVFDRSLKFQVHEKTHQTVVSVIDTKTKKVIREIPSKEALDMVAKMEDYLGLVFDKKA